MMEMLLHQTLQSFLLVTCNLSLITLSKSKQTLFNISSFILPDAIIQAIHVHLPQMT